MAPSWWAARALHCRLCHSTSPRACCLQVLAEAFFQGYRRVDLKPHEVLLRVKLPWTREHEYVKEFKQAHRQDDDIAIVNAGMRVQLEPSQSGVVSNLCHT